MTLSALTSTYDVSLTPCVPAPQCHFNDNNHPPEAPLVTLTRAEGNWAGDLDLTRRSIALALAGGYAVAAYSADADPIHTDDKGLMTETVEITTADRKIPGFLARPEGRANTQSCLSIPRSSAFMSG